MPHAKRWFVAAIAALLTIAPHANAQALPAAERSLQLATFATAAERYTQLSGAKNIDFTAGIDIGLLPMGAWLPALELRGSLPIMKGSVAGEAEFLGGLRLGKRLGNGAGRALVYGNVLAGRGQLTYFRAGLQVPGQNVFYTQSHSNIVSPGGGLEVDSAGPFALKLDIQLERYTTPVTTSGQAWATVAAVGLLYRLDSNDQRIR